MLRYGYTEPKTAAGRAERDKRVREVVAALGDRERLASQIAAQLGWSDWMTGAVLDAGMASGRITRRREEVQEQQNRLVASIKLRARQRCWVYKASGSAPPVAREPRQLSRLYFRPLGDV